MFILQIAQVVPDALVQQLKVGGRLIIPVGETRGEQKLLLIEKTATQVRSEVLEAVRFVPLVHGELQ